VLACITPVWEAEEGGDHRGGAGRPEGPHPLQDAFDRFGAAQCGFCTPGILCSAAALLQRNPGADREEVKEALSGNLCRCTGYTKILDAVLAAGSREGRPAGDVPRLPDGRRMTPCPTSIVGHNQRKVDGQAKASGRARYTDDLSFPGMLHGKILRSPHPHARILSIDTSEAEALEGVRAVVTAGRWR
jgi:nicotinate dehydrogenase large molybdopterin subunit